MNQYVQRFMPGAIVILFFGLRHVGFTFVESLAIAVPTVLAAELAIAIVDPGVKAKPWVERLRDRVHSRRAAPH